MQGLAEAMSRSIFARLHHRFGAGPSAAERRQRLAYRINKASPTLSAFRIDIQSLDRLPRRKVVVVGAGLAGLMAARTLAPKYDVTVLEAADRVGGRVLTLRDDKSKRLTEAGAELIGYCHPVWLRLAQEFGLGLSVWTSESDFDALRLEQPFVFDGHQISDGRAKKIYEEMEAALKLMVRHAQAIGNPYEPWKARGAQRLDTMSFADWVDGLKCSSITKHVLNFQYANTNGAPPERQSYLANLALIAGGAMHGEPADFLTLSENVRCARGNDRLAAALVEDMKRSNAVVSPSDAATAIEIDRDRVTVVSSRSGSMSADAIVLAVPPSVWKDIEITPEITKDYRMSMGSAVKYLSRSGSRFWLGEGKAPTASSNRLGVTWEGTDNQMQAEGQDVELTVFAGADAADRAVDLYRVSGIEAVRNHYDQEIGRLYDRYTQNRDASTVFKAWPLEKYIETGYSCPAPGEVTTVGPKLNRPFHKRLFFAGEHVCIPFFGYMEGALQSGARAAKAIARFLR